MVKTVADLNAEIDAQFADNHSRSITPSKQRTVLKDIVTNIPVTAGQVLADAGAPSSTTYLRGDNTWNTPPGGSGSSITGGGLGFNFASLTDAMATSLDPGIAWFRTAGFASPGDKGDGLYAKLTSDPAWATTEPNPSGAIAGRNAGVPTTNGGTFFWTLVPQDGLVKPTQFGAKTNQEWNDPSLDQEPFFEDAIWFIVNQGYESGLTLFIPSSWYHLARPMTCHGETFNVKGSGSGWDDTVLWWPHTTHGIIVGYAQAGFITIDAEGGPYNGTFAGLFVGDTRYGIGADTNHVYICTTAGIPGGWNATLGTWASPPTGTGSDIIDGTVHWAYQRELTRLEKHALTSFHGGGGYFQHLEVYCGTDWLTVTPRTNHSGVVFRNRGVVQDVVGASWPGCGIVFCSDGDTMFRGGSNSDGWRADHIVCYWNGADGLHLGNSKTNAGTLIDGDFASNGRWGIANWCFLDNSFTSIQFAYDGNVDNGAHAEYPHGASYNGRWYIARMPIGGIEDPGPQTDTRAGSRSFAIYQSPTPDINSFWTYIGGDGTWGPSSQYPAWSNTGLYEPGGGFSGNNFNDRTVVQKLYQESGTFTCQFMPFNLILGGLLQSGYGGMVLNDRNWNQTVSVAGGGVNTATGIAKAIKYNFGYGNGGVLTTNSYPKVILDINEYEGTRFLLEGTDQTRFDQTDWHFATLATNGSTKYPLMVMCTWNTAKQFGTGVPQPGATLVNVLAVGDSSGGDGRIMRMGTAAPTSGTHGQGEIVWNMAAAVGQPKGWQCTVTGTPGTWVSMGNL